MNLLLIDRENRQKKQAETLDYIQKQKNENISKTKGLGLV